MISLIVYGTVISQRIATRQIKGLQHVLYMGETHSSLNVDPNVCGKVFEAIQICTTLYFVHRDMVKEGALTEYSKTLIT